jgi:hypothetical protein
MEAICTDMSKIIMPYQFKNSKVTKLIIRIGFHVNSCLIKDII